MSRRALVAVLAVATAAIIAAVMVVNHALTRPQRLPVVVSVRVSCPAWSGGPPATPARGAGQLLPEAGYHMVYVCADGETQPVPGRVLTRLDANILVRRINALPTERPPGPCATERGPLFDVVFAEGSTKLVLQIDAAQCGLVHRDGITRYGGDQVHRDLTRYITTGRV
jgi:hypothetical protein